MSRWQAPSGTPENSACPAGTRLPNWALCLICSVLPALAFLLPSYQLLRLNQHLLLAINVLALNFCLGLGGQAAMAQGAFCGLGAYASVVLHSYWPGGSLVIVPAVAVFAWLLGVIISYPLSRLSEGFLAMATLGLALIFGNLAVSLVSLTGGPDGRVVDTPLTLLGWPIAGDRTYALLFCGLLGLGLWIFLALKHSRLGRAMLACKADPMAAATCGVSSAGVRSMAFGLGAGLSAVAGAFFAHYARFVSPNEFGLEMSLKALLYLVIGGPGRPLAPIAATLALESLLAHGQFLGEARTLFHGLLLATALAAPQVLERLRPHAPAKD